MNYYKKFKLLFLMLLFTLCTFCTGCKSPFFKSNQGQILNAGILLPNSLSDIQIMSFLNGHNVTIKDKSDITFQWMNITSNSYFNVIKTHTINKGEINVKK